MCLFPKAKPIDNDVSLRPAHGASNVQLDAACIYFNVVTINSTQNEEVQMILLFTFLTLVSISLRTTRVVF